MKYEIREIKSLSFAGMSGIAFALITTMGSLPYLVIFWLLGSGFYSFELGMFAWILGIIVVAYLVGIAFSFLFAVIYNAIAHGSKGIELEIDIVKDEVNK